MFVMSSLAIIAAPSALPALPLHYGYGGYPKISTNISYGTPPQEPSIPTVVDLGSANFWVFGAESTINSGSNYLLVPGPCNETPKPNFNTTASTSATEPAVREYGYAYGGNGKLVSGHFAVNDTLHFSGTAYPGLSNQQVAIANYTIVKQLAQTCTGAPYEVSILGLSPSEATGGTPLIGPSFRQNLLDNDQVKSQSFSMWFDEHTGSIKEDFIGTALFGAVPTSKYSGPLVKFIANPPEDQPYVGYYISAPSFKSSPLNDTDNVQELPAPESEWFTKPVRCLIDSGFGEDTLPISVEDFLSVTGLVMAGGYPSYNGSCDDIPRHATLDFDFTNEQNKSVSVKVPLRNYARGNTDYLNGQTCGLSLTLGESNCYLGAPFFTGAFLAFNDETAEIAVAQGGVSTGAELGPAGYGEIVVIEKGQGLSKI